MPATLSPFRAPRRPFVVALAISAAAFLVPPGVASAATVLNGKTYTVAGAPNGEHTWTKVGSPYVLQGNIYVDPGATLRIEPGVVVKVKGMYQIRVKGALKAIGTAAERIVFTSYQDDSAGGDTNADGAATSGAPGQWYKIEVTGPASTQSELRYVTVRYGGNGSGAYYLASALYAYDGAKAAVSHSLFEHNKYYAVRAADCTASGQCSEISVDSSVLSDNAGGVTTLNGVVHLRKSVAVGNLQNGARYMLTTSYRGPASEVTDSDIEQNGQEGVYLSIDETTGAQVPTVHWPHGNRNNIWQNNLTDSLQLRGRARREVDWKDNFWGTSTVFGEGPPVCAASGFPGRLRYPAAGDDPNNLANGAGPITSKLDFISGTACYHDAYDTGRCGFTKTRLFHRDGAPDLAIDPRDQSSRPPPLALSGSLWDARCTEIDGTSYTLDVATDPGPGPANVAILVDGTPVLPEGTPNAASRTWAFDATSYSVGEHEITVEATDHLNRTSAENFTVEIPDTTPPTLEPLEGSLYEARGTIVRGADHTLHVDAADPAGQSGLDHIEITVKKTTPSGTVTDTRTVAPGTWTFDDGVHGPSAPLGEPGTTTDYTFEMTAVDNAGNRSVTQSFSLKWSSKACGVTPLGP